MCRHVVMETWEQKQAMNPYYTRDIDSGYQEIS